MTKYIVQGGHPLFGEVRISGAKNAAVAIIPAALLVDGVCRIENIPQISDVTALLKILEQLGANVRFLNRSDVEIDCRHIATTQVSQELAHKIRASYYLIGALLGRFGEAEVSMPGGCNFGGVRPIDQHVKGFAAMGAEVREGDFICAKASGDRMKGANVYLDVVSVGATMNIMMAAALADGTTVIENAAKEPHIVDLANFLNSMGANIKGAGTDTIRIFGVDKLHGGTYAIIPDQIEAGTYMAAVAACGGQVLVRGIIPKHMDCITAKLREMGVKITEQGDALLIQFGVIFLYQCLLSSLVVGLFQFFLEILLSRFDVGLPSSHGLGVLRMLLQEGAGIDRAQARCEGCAGSAEGQHGCGYSGHHHFT